uniref:Putative E3 ubiquitin-protein ligase LIN N-terminal domain-containing protein n=1 Tax=Salix viminalis TaxID=40686 RepID=A0A6N2KMD7_SALVM
MEETSIDKWNTKKIATKTVSHPNPPPVLHCLPLRNPLPTQDHRHHLFSTLCRKAPPSNKTTTIKPLNLVVENLEIAISATNPSIQSSSLRLAEKVLLSYPDSLLSSLLLSLIYILSNRPTNASISLLNIFHLDPSLARSEIAPVLFEELFLVHLLPVLRWFNEQRSRILSSLTLDKGYDNDENSIGNMSGDQALELKGLESIHEEDLDENCKVFAKYFKELVTNGDDNRIMTTPPSVILKELGKAEKSDASDEISRWKNSALKMDGTM